MKLHVTFETGSPSKLEGLDGAVAVVYQDDRPLRGLAVRADWRLNGFLSRLVVEERFQAEPGEWLLVHTQGRLPFTHLFLVGMGRRSEHSEASARRTLETVAGKVALAGLHALAIDLSEVVGETMAMDDAMFLFLEGMSKNYPQDELSAPPYRPAVDVTRRNEERLQAFRDRRQALIEARQEWERAHVGASDSGEFEGPDVDDEVGEETVIDAGSAGAESSGGVADESVAEAARIERPVAGALPEEDEQQDAVLTGDGLEAPPDPESLEAPELEPSPERTVRIVLIGDGDSLGPMRRALRESGSDASASLAVEWSR